MPSWLSHLVLTKATPHPVPSSWILTLSRHFALRPTPHLKSRQDEVDAKQTPSKLGNRVLKARRPSPSKILEDVARALDVTHAIPAKRPYKHDLSYISARQADQKTQRQRVRRLGQEGEQDLRLQGILARYIVAHGHHSGLSGLGGANGDWTAEAPVVPESSISEAQASVLKSRGYNHADLQLWASIYCEPQSEVAAVKLLARSGFITDPSEHANKPLPVFLILQLLTRNHMTPAALRCLLIYTSCELDRKRSLSIENSGSGSGPSLYPTVNESSMLIILVRLLRHARECLPEAVPTIGKLFIAYTEARAQSQSLNNAKLYHKRLREITYLYNRMIGLLGIPSKLRPFHAVAFHQRAQFDLVQAMAKYTPALPISFEAYRGVVNMQLANKKTEQERDWDSLKARSWPPWKEERTGFDAEKDVEYGTSRALTVLNRAREAGYGFAAWADGATDWDQAAKILSGWHVDGSPTIQTRSFVVIRSRRRRRGWRMRTSRRLIINYSADKDRDDLGTAAVWTARIRATRTIHEAWACFLALSNNACRVPSVDVYFAMLEKLAYPPANPVSAARIMLDDDDSLMDDEVALNSGDRRETMSEPISPKEATYVSIKPPSFDGLATQMLQAGFLLSWPRLAFLLTHTATFELGLMYLETAAQKRPELSLLVGETISGGASLPSTIVSSFINFLCRFPGGPAYSKSTADATSRFKRAVDERSPLLHAMHLLQTQRIIVHSTLR